MLDNPYFHGVGPYVEDSRESRPDVCRVDYDEKPSLDKPTRTYQEACELARQIADALNRLYPNANSRKR